MPKDLKLSTALGKQLATGTRLTNLETKMLLTLARRLQWNEGLVVDIVQSPKPNITKK
ncbi:MAG: hypothetical protein V4722_04455 [Bacteroidota bacterium]